MWPPKGLAEALDSDSAPPPPPPPPPISVTPDAIRGPRGYEWIPLPGSQVIAMICPADVILAHGTRAGGKTETQLMYFRQHVGKGYGSFWRGLIYDTEYKCLDDLIAKSRRCLGQWCDGARFLESSKDLKWVWPTGEELLFRAAAKERDYENFHGHEYPFIGPNELTKHPTSDLFDALFSCNRSGFVPSEHSPRDSKTGALKPLPEIPLVVFATTNPWGAGHAWVKQRFIDAAGPGQIHRTKQEVFNPRTRQKEIVTRRQTHLYSSWRDNKYLSPSYIATLSDIKDPIKRKAWLDGDWDIAVGGAFGYAWDRDLHILPRFKIPKSWMVYRSMDWGTSRPFSIGWWAVANGEEVRLPSLGWTQTPGGVLLPYRTFCPPPGTRIRIAEWYGAEDLTKNVGLNLGPTDVAKGILQREASLLANGWIAEPPEPGPADNSIDTAADAESISVKTRMETAGVRWKESNKKPGSRKAGVTLFCEMLQAAKTGDGPAAYTMQNCPAYIALTPTVPRDPDDPDDVDTNAIDHLWDETRYSILYTPTRGVSNIEIVFPT